MKILFAGTPEFAQKQLAALLTTTHEIVAVYTQPDKPAGRGQHLHISAVKELALAHNLPIEQPLSLKDPIAQATLTNYQPDVIVVAAYGLLLPEAVLQLPRYGCINVHASLLPRWRGASPIQQAILSGDAETGITLMRMEIGLDTGNCLTASALKIEADDTTATLHDKLADLGAALLVAKLSDIVAEPGTPQAADKVTYAPKISKSAAQINWQQSAAVIERQIRAYTPWPIAYTQIDGQVLRILQARVVEITNTAPAGTILEQTAQGILVNTANQALLITQAQLPGKKILPMSEILKGHAVLFTPTKMLG